MKANELQPACRPAPAVLEDEFGVFFRGARATRLRSMREWAEQEIVIPSGPFEGRRFRCHRQPFIRHWFDEIDSGRWARYAATGPSQSGKTLACSVIPVCYHLFELRDTVVFGLPDMEMSADKWRRDFRPVIERTRYRHLLPSSGSGSRGGKVVAITFGNGAELRFMGGGGGDKQRAHYTARAAVITEADGMDKTASTSREADQVEQIEARTRSFGEDRRIYLECTVSTDRGRIWREYKGGSASEVHVRCPHCRRYVYPEREHLVGWQDAEDVIEAKEGGAFVCPACGVIWSEDDRRVAVAESVLVHSGQTVTEQGQVVGELPRTDTLGFRWSAPHNLFVPAGEVAADEWRGSRSSDEENAEKKLLQFVWALPWVDPEQDTTPLEVQALMRRTRPYGRGELPAECQHLTLGVDLGKYLVHWAAIGWGEGATGYLIEYGRVEVPSDQFGVERALLVALRELRDRVQEGWPVVEGDPEKPRIPDQVWIDAGYQPDVVYQFCRQSAEGGFLRFRPAVGRGETQVRRQRYLRPRTTGAVVKHIGQDYHIVRQKRERIPLVEVNADAWKSWMHERLAAPIAEPGALAFYRADPREHMSFARHLTAERQVEEYLPERGTVIVWRRERKNNHWLDACYLAAAAGHFAGVRVTADDQPVKRRSRARRPRHVIDIQRGDEPFVATDRER